MKMNFFVVKEEPNGKSTAPFKLPIGDPGNLLIQPKGSMVYSPEDNFVYVSDGVNWDRVSGVNNPVDLLLPITQNRLSKWTEDYPPGGAYTSPVLQDSSLEVDDDGNSILNDTGNTPSSFPWLNGNFMAHGSISTSYSFGISTDSTDSTLFSPILTQIKGEGETKYDQGSISVGSMSMDSIVSIGPDVKSNRNVSLGVSAAQYLSPESADNVFIGWSTSKDVKDLNGCVSIGSNSSVKKDGNVVVGCGSLDSNLESVIVIGSKTQAKESNTLVLGSGIQTIEVSDETMHNKVKKYMKIQIGSDVYLMPLIKM